MMSNDELLALVHACQARGLSPEQVAQMMAAIIETRWLLLSPSMRQTLEERAGRRAEDDGVC